MSGFTRPASRPGSPHEARAGMKGDEERDVGFLDVVRSVLAAFLGVQSNRNRERDFQRGKPVHFIAVGLLATAVFVLVMWGLVKLFLWAVL